MNEPGKTNGHSDPVVKKLVAVCLEEADRFARGVFDRAREQHPREAKAIERQYQALRSSGLVGRGPMDGKGPDPWEAGAREVLSDPEAARKFETIGPYQPLKEIGRGGQAVVYLAEDLRLHRPVALKILDGLGPLSETMMSRFRREAEVASKLDHPGICSVYDAGVKDGVPYIAMRFVAGESLADRIEAAKTGPEGGNDRSLSVGSVTKIEINRVLEIMEKAARALHAAHEAGIVHRDIKPGNIMVTPQGEPVLLDFGLAGDEDGGLMTLTATGDMLGTPAYMSPEQLMAQRIRLDRRTDVYSMGVTLFECLTLERPYRAKTREAMYQAIQYKDPTDIQGLNAGLPPDVKVVVETALEKDRDKRYRTAEDLAEDLRRAREGEPIAARPVSALGRVRRWARRRPFRAALIVALVIGVPALTALAGHIIANRPAVLEAERQAFLAEVEEHLEEGFSELGHRDARQAVVSFDAALALKPDSAEAIGGKALALQLSHLYAACLEFLDAHGEVKGGEWAMRRLRIDTLKALGRKGEADDLAKKTTARPTTALGYFLAGMQLKPHCDREIDKKGFRAALRNFRRAVLASTHARPLYHYQLAHAAGHLREEDPARESADALVSLWPDSYKAHEWAGFALYCVGAPEAIAVSRRVIELKPDDLRGYGNLGGRLAEAGRPDEAIAVYRKAIELDPYHAGTYSAFGAALLQKCLYDESVAACRKAIELEPDHASAHNNLGSAFCEKGELENGVAAYRKAIELKPDHASAHANLGETLAGLGRFEEALEVCRKALKLLPNNAGVFRSLGLVHSKKGELDEAIEAYKKAVALDPDHANAYYPMGVALAEKGRHDAAIEVFERSIELKPTPDAYHALAMSLDKKGRFDEAIAACRKAIASCRKGAEHRSNEALTYGSLGLVLAHMGRADEALAAYHKAIELDPNCATAYYNLGISLVDKGQVDDAMAANLKAIEIEPDYAAAYDNFGVCYQKKGDWDKALAHHLKATELDPDYANAWDNLGVVYTNMGKSDKAIEAHKKAIKLQPGFSQAYVSLGTTLVAKGDLVDAIGAYRKAIELDPRNAKAYACFGVALHRQGKHDEAIASYRRAVELEPNDSYSHGNIGMVLWLKGRFDEAIAAIRNAIGLDPDRAQLHDLLGAVLRDSGKLDEAIAAYHKAVGLKPDLSPFHHNLARALGEAGRLDDQIAALRRAVRLKPDDAAAYRKLGSALRTFAPKLRKVLRGSGQAGRRGRGVSTGRARQPPVPASVGGPAVEGRPGTGARARRGISIRRGLRCRAGGRRQGERRKAARRGRARGVAAVSSPLASCRSRGARDRARQGNAHREESPPSPGALDVG